MRQNALIRKFLNPLKLTPLHPQWFVFKGEIDGLRQIGKQAKKIVLDIGAGEQKIEGFLPEGCIYLSLDYYQTATEWYATHPCIFGDAQYLPLRDNCVDTVLLLDVLEHLPNSAQGIAEIWRVLRPGGVLILQVPFLYPLHDVPYDFQRWTEYGLRNLAEAHQFELIKEMTWGHPLETSALLNNLAISRSVLQWLKHKNPLSLLSPLLLLFIPSGNIAAWLFSRLSKSDDFMPHSYRATWRKPG